jgi:hypothetical protein
MSSRTFNNPNSDAARQALLDNRCEHKGKNHRTLGRRRRLSKQKRQQIKERLAAKIKAYREYKTKVREYWNYQGDHPSQAR